LRPGGLGYRAGVVRAVSMSGPSPVTAKVALCWRDRRGERREQQPYVCPALGWVHLLRGEVRSGEQGGAMVRYEPGAGVTREAPFRIRKGALGTIGGAECKDCALPPSVVGVMPYLVDGLLLTVTGLLFLTPM
jgi:hypothetical protein